MFAAMRKAAVLGLLLATVLALGCGKRADDASSTPKVAVSIFPLYDVTRRIAGERVSVMIVLPPGKSEHSYEPAPQDVVALSAAKIAFVVGHGLDAWVEPVVRDARIIRLGERVKPLPVMLEPISEATTTHDGHDDHGHDDHDHGHAHGNHAPTGAPDPHFWLDPERVAGIVDVIAAELATLDPEGKETFLQNADAVKASLRALDKALLERARAWPVGKRNIVTFHGSMTYFAARYGLRIVAVVEPVAGTEPTSPYIIKVLDAIRLSNAAAIFSEPQLDRAPGQTIAREAKIPLGELDPIGGLDGRDTYEKLLTWNVDQLDKVLQ